MRLAFSDGKFNPLVFFDMAGLLYYVPIVLPLFELVRLIQIVLLI